MLIKDFDGSSLAKYKKASRMLESLYGIKISKSNDLSKLHEGLGNAKGIISKLKEQNKAINDRDVLKYTLISEALQDLIDFENKNRLDELDSSYSNSIKYKQILSWLADYCTKCMDIGDSMEDSVYDAMKQYRSSQYRFPDAQVESDLYEYIMSRAEGYAPSKSSLLDSMSPEAIQEMFSRLKEACNSDKIDESLDKDLYEFAKAVVEGNFGNTYSHGVSDEQAKTAKAYLDNIGSSLKLADPGTGPYADKQTSSKSTAKPHPKQRFYNPE